MDSARAIRSRTRAAAANIKANAFRQDDPSAPMLLASQAEVVEASDGATAGVQCSPATLGVVTPSQTSSQVVSAHEPALSQLRTYAGRKKSQPAISGLDMDVTGNEPEDHFPKGKARALQPQLNTDVPGTLDKDVNDNTDVQGTPNEDNDSEEEDEDVVAHSIRMAKKERLEQQRHRAHRHFVFSGEHIEVEPFISHVPIRMNSAYVAVPPRPSTQLLKSKGKEQEIQGDAHDGDASGDDSSNLGDHQQSPEDEGTASRVDYDAEAVRLSATRNSFGKYVRSISNKGKAVVPERGTPPVESDLTGSSWSEDRKLGKARRANRHHRPESDTEEEDAQADDEELAKPNLRGLPDLMDVSDTEDEDGEQPEPRVPPLRSATKPYIPRDDDWVDFDADEIDEEYDGEQFPPIGNVEEETPPLAVPGATMSAGRYSVALVEKCRTLGSDVFTSVKNIAEEHNVGRHVIYKLSKLVFANQTNNPYNDFLSWFSRMRNMDPKYEPFGGRELITCFPVIKLLTLNRG